jgi:hypothetical protein
VRLYVEGQAIPIEDFILDQRIDLEIRNTDTTTIYRIATVDKSGKESLGIRVLVSRNNAKIL